MRIVYDAGIPPYLLGLLQPQLDAVAPKLAPAWCREITVYYGGGSDHGAALSIEVQADYRRASMTVKDAFASTGSDEERRGHVIHEMCHFYTSPIADMAGRLVQETWEPNSTSRRIWEREHTICVEQCTCDLEVLVGKLLGDSL